MPRTALSTVLDSPVPSPITNQSNSRDGPIAAMEEGKQDRKRKRESPIEGDRENRQTAGSLDLRTMIEISVQAARLKRHDARQEARLQEQLLEEHGSEEDPDDREESNGSEYHEEGGTGEEQDGSDTDASEQDQLEADRPQQTSPNDNPVLDQNGQNDPTSTAPSSMSAQEKKLWAMNFEELYKYAASKNFGKTGKESRKSGRIKIIKWLCDKQGIIQYVAPTITPVESTPVIARPSVTPSGAISHPEAILRTSNPALQRLIDEKEQKYKKIPHAQLTELAMKRSYQLFKDSKGKLPSKYIAAMSQWLAAWEC